MEGTDRIGYSYGRILTNIEQASLACSAPLIHRDFNGTVTFWGKVLGQQSDYLICSVLKSRYERTWVFSVDNGLTWNSTVNLNDEQRHYCQLTKGPFKGNPRYEYKFREEIPPDPEPVAEQKLQEEKRDDQDDDEDKEEEEKDDEEDHPEEKEEKDEDTAQEAEVQKKKTKETKNKRNINIREYSFITFHS